MSKVNTEFGTLRKFGNSWVLVCPVCGETGRLDDDQLNGRISVDHTSDKCTYHETHNFKEAIEKVAEPRDKGRK